MNIDTLILSGGSTRGISFLGAIKYLVENNNINNNFKNIKKIICVSASFIFVLTIILTLLSDRAIFFKIETVPSSDALSIKICS